MTIMNSNYLNPVLKFLKNNFGLCRIVLLVYLAAIKSRTSLVEVKL